MSYDSLICLCIERDRSIQPTVPTKILIIQVTSDIVALQVNPNDPSPTNTSINVIMNTRHKSSLIVN